MKRPDNCECDNTHEQNNTCCMPCWEAGFRSVPTPEELARSAGWQEESGQIYRIIPDAPEDQPNADGY